jgi:hypothetical protein
MTKSQEMYQGSYLSRMLLTITNLTASPAPSASYEYMPHGSLHPACPYTHREAYIASGDF